MKKISIFSRLAAAMLLLSACGDSSSPDSAAAAANARSVPVIAQKLKFERERVRVEAVGTSRARLSAELYAPTSGEVVAVNFEPGQAVKKGDVLLQLDAEKEKLAVRLVELRLEEAERLLDRYSRSADSGAVLPTVLDAARIAAETAEVELEQARIALADRTVRAVFDGYVGGTDIDPGDRIDTNTLITTLDDRSSLLVSFAVPEAFTGELSVGDPVHLEPWTGTGEQVDGSIIDIGSRIDPGNRTFVVRAGVENSRDQLRPGMSFRVRVDVEGERYAVVSEVGLQWGADGAYVWTIVDGIAVQAPVQIIQRREGRVLIDTDLTDGAIVVVEGTQNMRDGIAVEHTFERVATGDSALPIAD
tara:strand:- start:10647 stop:11729 length:1083 start_codon:yes stop_codon:yes gene_type:complete